jgi:hypothetical protein
MHLTATRLPCGHLACGVKAAATSRVMRPKRNTPTFFHPASYTSLLIKAKHSLALYTPHGCVSSDQIYSTTDDFVCSGNSSEWSHRCSAALVVPGCSERVHYCATTFQRRCKGIDCQHHCSHNGHRSCWSSSL